MSESMSTEGGSWHIYSIPSSHMVDMFMQCCQPKKIHISNTYLNFVRDSEKFLNVFGGYPIFVNIPPRKGEGRGITQCELSYTYL